MNGLASVWDHFDSGDVRITQFLKHRVKRFIFYGWMGFDENTFLFSGPTSRELLYGPEMPANRTLFLPIENSESFGIQITTYLPVEII